MFKPGQIVKINPKKSYSPESLLLLHSNKKDFKLYANIDIESYPSCSDFKGYYREFKNENFLVIKKIGRPTSFSNEEHWNLYDVYQVMYCNVLYECFSYCFEKLEDFS